VLDLGAGPGAAAWAATATFPTVCSVTCIEADSAMGTLGRRLSSRSTSEALRSARWVHGDARLPEATADLVIASYVLGELPVPADVSGWWSAANEVLVIVEPGTVAGFERVRAARAALIEAGATVVAPCPHDRPCPMPEGDWCHFSVRLNRSARHRDAKGGALAYEDEKYAYVAVARAPGTRAQARVLRHPQVRSGHIRFELCTLDGLENRVVSRRTPDDWRTARHTGWGDRFA
jgi:ribosomal protein RSM22 (predicted rRNA methylase)